MQFAKAGLRDFTVIFIFGPLSLPGTMADPGAPILPNLNFCVWILEPGLIANCNHSVCVPPKPPATDTLGISIDGARYISRVRCDTLGLSG
jgi:hypothetical protein